MKKAGLWLLAVLLVVTGGCGKMEQWPLRVAFGGPHIRVNGIQVQ